MNKITGIAAILSALIMAGTLLSGKAGLRFTHTPNFKALKNNDTFKLQIENGKYAIYISSEIKEDDKYTDLIMWINTNRHLKSVDVYLAGYGGRVSSTVLLVQAMRESPTKYRAVIYGNVYSGHAFLAVNLQSIKYYSPNTLLMFHGPGIRKGKDILTPLDNCRKVKGTDRDRGVKSKTKCLRSLKPHEKAFYAALGKRLKLILTDQEWKYYNEGRDVYITTGRMKEGVW